MYVKQLDHLNLTVRDFEETASWYHRVFGFDLVERGVRQGRRWGILKSGEALLCIYEHPELQRPADEDGAGSGFHHINHFAFRITDSKKWQETMARQKVSVAYGGPVRWNHSTAWYVEDPSGYEIEVACWDGDQVSFS